MVPWWWIDRLDLRVDLISIARLCLFDIQFRHGSLSWVQVVG